ncbi:MAG: aminopeptidase P family protein [Chloroflexi bacterium]|nr:aminopeptidase P family protein [Chloroflexota bacterium]
MLNPVEGQRRAQALAAQVAASVDAVLCTAPENIYFFSGFRTMLYTRFSGVIVRMDRPAEPALIVSSIDRLLIQQRVWSPPWVTTVAYHGTEPLPDVAATPSAALAPHMAGVRRLGVDSLKLTDLDEVKAAAPGVEIVPLNSAIEGLKELKGPDEIGWMRRANALAVRGIETARDMLNAGPVTELELAVRLESEARLGGADGFGYPTLVSFGAKMGAAHSPALPRKVEASQPLRIAFGPAVEGYTADIVRTFCLGEPPALLTRLQDGFREAQDACFNLLRDGARVPDMMAAVRAVYAKRDLLSYWRNNIGHGLGLTIHEPPRIGGTSKAVLATNMVVAIEPSLTAPGFGGYSHCDVLLVTPNGADLLTPGFTGIVRAG